MSFLDKIPQNPLAWLSLIMILTSVIFNIYWLWGLLMMAWVVKDIEQKSTWLSETVVKADNPVLYYLIVSSWLLIGLYFLSELLYYI